MKASMLFLFVVIVTPQIILAMPSYLKPCKMADADTFNKCALEHANQAIPHLIKGDKKYGIPVLNPLFLPYVSLDTDNIKILLKDTNLFGLDQAIVKKMDLERDRIKFTIHVENVQFVGQYALNGKLLLFTLNGRGNSNITGLGGDFTFHANLETYAKNGVNYLRYKNPDLHFKLDRAIFKFDDLFKGNEQLTRDVNHVLNENWAALIEDLGQPIKEAFLAFCDRVVSGFLAKIPEDRIFPS